MFRPFSIYEKEIVEKIIKKIKIGFIERFKNVTFRF